MNSVHVNTLHLHVNEERGSDTCGGGDTTVSAVETFGSSPSKNDCTITEKLTIMNIIIAVGMIYFDFYSLIFIMTIIMIIMIISHGHHHDYEQTNNHHRNTHIIVADPAEGFVLDGR